MGPPGKSIPVRASVLTSAGSSSKGAPSAISKSIASTSASVARPLPTPASTVGPSTTRSVSSKRKMEEPTPGPSKIRRVGGARSVSTSNAVASSSKTDVRISAPKPLFTFVPMEPKTSAVTSSGSASTSKKRPSDEGLPGPSSAKMQRLSGWPTVGERKAAKPAKLTQSVAPLKVPDPSSRNTAPTKENEKKKAHTSQRSVGNASSVSATASAAIAPTPVKGTPKPRPVVKPGSLVQPQPQAKPRTESKKHVRPAPAAGVAASSASSGFSTSTRGSSSSSSARTSATPASDRAGPSAPGPSKRAVTNCRDCGGWIDPHGKNGMCTMCCVESLPAAPAPAPAPAPAVPPQRCATCGHKWTGKGAECTKCQLKALAHSTETPQKRVSKKMRQREFGRWFARWTAAHRAATDAAEGGDEDKTDWWRVETTRNQGGVCYPTPEAFFAALEDALVRYRESAKDNLGEKEGKGGVLTFYGGYSIVAQPKISAMARLDKLVGRMEEIGFRLDSALQGYMKFRYRSAGGTMDEVYKYPCTCGGAPPPVAENEMRHAHRIPDEKYAGEVCGGTIMLMVGEDNARLAYGIQGQRIAVDIVH
ncbi:hypothetical protein LXA43DRAFT_970963 [Ganoderma leucocontextum]|nr:hypothetical protein LXA43DRAFT_970963 [Ganoderma leucocontextum]